MQLRGWSTLQQPCTRIACSILHSPQRCPPPKHSSRRPRPSILQSYASYLRYTADGLHHLLSAARKRLHYLLSAARKPLSKPISDTSTSCVAAICTHSCPNYLCVNHRSGDSLESPSNARSGSPARGNFCTHRGARQPIRLSWSAFALNHSQHISIRLRRGCPSHRENASSSCHVRWEVLVGWGCRVERLDYLEMIFPAPS